MIGDRSLVNCLKRNRFLWSPSATSGAAFWIQYFLSLPAISFDSHVESVIQVLSPLLSLSFTLDTNRYYRYFTGIFFNVFELQRIFSQNLPADNELPNNSPWTLFWSQLPLLNSLKVSLHWSQGPQL